MKHRNSLKDFSQSATARLALSYLAIIMIMSIGFSIIFFYTSSNQLGRQLPQHGPDNDHSKGIPDNGQYDAFFQQRIAEGRHQLLLQIIYINVLVLIGGAILSYYLARRTLKPIEDNMEAQSQFVSDASHELRTPLTSLQTANEVALRKSTVTQKQAKDIFNQNVEDVIKLRNLTDSLLNLALTDNGGSRLKPTDLNEIVSDSINAVLEKAILKKISIDDKVPKLTVLADKTNLIQAITTILDNAIKYSPSNSLVFITSERHRGQIFLNIKDQGIGINKVHLPHIFERFYRIDESRNKQSNDGYGIGLSLANKIIEQHGGKITVKSTPGEGSTFTLRLRSA